MYLSSRYVHFSIHVPYFTLRTFFNSCTLLHATYIFQFMYLTSRYVHFSIHVPYFTLRTFFNSCTLLHATYIFQFMYLNVYLTRTYLLPARAIRMPRITCHALNCYTLNALISDTLSSSPSNIQCVQYRYTAYMLHKIHILLQNTLHSLVSVIVSQTPSNSTGMSLNQL